jgi:hypothetical protein
MRIWDIPPKCLCRQHLLGEHRELHAIWKILIENKVGYSKHPETIRWKGKLRALYLRHEQLVVEMTKRGYKHNSKLDKKYAKGKAIQNYFLDKPNKQKVILKNKPCPCFNHTTKQK